MPTTEPLDAYSLTDDDIGGHLKSIARTAADAPAPAASDAPDATRATAPAAVRSAVPGPTSVPTMTPQGIVIGGSGSQLPPGVTVQHLGPRNNAPGTPDLASFRHPSLRRDPRADNQVHEARRVDAAVADAPFADEQLRQAWLDFAAGHSTEVILANTMRASLPVRSAESPSALSVTVENPIQVKLIDEHREQILAHLAARLNNNTLTLTAGFNAERGSSYTWNDREVLSDIAGRSETLMWLIDKMSMKLS